MKLTKNDAGCWFDSARGIYIGEAVIDLAIEHGFDPKEEEPKGGWSHYEYYDELQDEAEDFLNEKFAPEDCYFGPNENGDWGLWEVEEN